MTEHYSGDDPETGCALMTIVTIAILAAVLIVLFLRLRG
jgi:hypothetical protein